MLQPFRSVFNPDNIEGMPGGFRDHVNLKVNMLYPVPHIIDTAAMKACSVIWFTYARENSLSIPYDKIHISITHLELAYSFVTDRPRADRKR